MSRRTGFLTRMEAAESFKKPRKRRRELSADLANQLGSAAAERMNPAAKHPNIPPIIAEEEGGIYFLWSSPSTYSDETGRAYAGAIGQAIQTEWMANNDPGMASFDYVIRTKVKDAKQLKGKFLEFFRKDVEESILKADPAVIVGLGKPALEWATGEVQVKLAAGKLFPIYIQGKPFWFMSTYDPDFLHQIEGERSDKVGYKEWNRLWSRHIEDAWELSGQSDPPEPYNTEELFGNTVFVRSVSQLKKELAKIGPLAGFDYETHRLRPYYDDAMVLTIAYSDGDHTVVAPLQHEEAPWSPDEYRDVIKILRKFHRKTTLIAHNLAFEMEWSVFLFGDEATTWSYHDTMQAVFVLDPGPPGERTPLGQSLDFQCLRYFGFRLKALTEGAGKRDRLRYVSLPVVEKYNGLDAKITFRLWVEHLEQLLEEEYVREPYDLQIERLPSVVRAQKLGVPVDQEENARLHADLKNQFDSVVAGIAKDPAVKKYKARFHKEFNPGSQRHVGQLLADVLEIPGVKKGKSYRTARDVLEPLSYDVPIVKRILDYRGASKLIGTYVDKFRMGEKDSFVYSDGKIHCQFVTSKTRTARWASQDPNNQNWPKRKNKHVRSQLKAPPGYVFVAVDHGQVEARCFAIESRDRKWVKMVRSGYDVHKEWSEVVQDLAPEWSAKHNGDQKFMRGEAKNKVVFPLFFGSSEASVTRSLGVTEAVGSQVCSMFWDEFEGVKKWQQKKWLEYQRTYAVRTLTNRIRRGPLSYNMVINTPIQSLAADIVVDGAVRLSQQAIDENKPWLQFVLQIHDDLTFLVPISELDDAIEDIVYAMLDYPGEFMNVPLSVEVEVGPDLSRMEPVITVSSDEVGITSYSSAS